LRLILAYYFFYFTTKFFLNVKLSNFELIYFFFSNELIKIIYIPFFLFIIGFSIVRYFVKPNFQIFVGQIDSGNLNGYQVRFLHFQVINLNWPKFFFLFRRNSASGSSAKIFAKKRNSNENPKEIIGRWSMRSEPISPTEIITTANKQIEISASDNIDDIKEGILDVIVVVKDANTEKFSIYLFNDLNYISLLKQDSNKESFPKYSPNQLQREEYDIQVTINGGRSKKSTQFLLTGLDNFYNVHLERIT